MTVSSQSLLPKISSQSSQEKICPLSRDFGRVKEQTTNYPTERTKSRCGRFVNRTGRGYTIGKTAWNQSAEHRDCSSEFSGSISLQEKATAPKGAVAVHIGRQCRPKNGVATAFSEICIVAAIRGCRVHLFQILASKSGLLK